MGIATYDINKVQEILNRNGNDERKMFFEGMGVNIENAQSLEMAIKLSGLDFEAEMYPSSETIKIPGIGYSSRLIENSDEREIHRTDTGKLMGRVKKNYNILQNYQAFEFMDELLGSQAKFETAGLFGRNQSKTFMTASTEPIKILGDDFQPYLLMTNGFDGGIGVRIAFTGIRIFCSNCLVRAFKNARNVISIKHSNMMMSKLDEAKYIMLHQTKYLEALKEESEKLAVTPFSAEAYEALIRDWFNKKDEDGNVIIQNGVMIEALLRAYKQEDLDNFSNTAYRAVQAIADVNSHMPSMRKTNNNEGNFMVVFNGMELFNTLTDKIIERAG